MRIGIDIRAADPAESGQQRYLWRLGAWLGGLGHAVHYLTVRRQSMSIEVPHGATLHRLKGVSRANLRATVEGLRLDALMLNPERSTRYRGVPANVLRAAYGTDQYSQKMRSFSPGPASLFRGALRQAPWTRARRRWERSFYEGRNPPPHIVAQSTYMREQILQSYNVPEPHVHVVRNGVDLMEFSPEPRRALRAEMRRRWRIDDDTLCLLTLGHNFRLKGVWRAFDALAGVRPERRIHLLVAGSGTGPAQVRKARALVRRKGLEHRVTLAGAVHPSLNALAAADALLHLSWHDSFAFVVLEAMACGLPVITTASVGAAELIEHGRSGLIVDPGRPLLVVQAIEYMREAALRERMGSVAAEVASFHSEESSFRRVLEVLTIALGKTRPRGRSPDPTT